MENDLWQCTYPCGYLASPNYPAMYPDSRMVTWHIQTVEDNYIQLEFLTFQVDSALKYCGQDFVEISNVLKNGVKGLIGRYCIPSPPPTVLLSGMNEMRVVFSSDKAYTNLGFFGHYSSQQYTLPQYIRDKITENGMNIELHIIYSNDTLCKIVFYSHFVTLHLELRKRVNIFHCHFNRKAICSHVYIFHLIFLFI